MDRLFYYPDRNLSNQDIADSLNFQKVTFRSKNGNNLSGYWVTAEDTAIASILFLHGNAGDINDRIESLEILRKNGFNILIFDYQGFGLSQGEVSHQNLAEDAESAMNFLLQKNAAKGLPVIILGRSIGGHLAVKTASVFQDKICAVVIEGAFTSHRNIAVFHAPLFLKPVAFLIVKSEYKAISHIKDINVPKLIIHSTEDEVIPYYMGVELYENATEPKDFMKIKGCHICGLTLYTQLYINKLRELCK